MTGLFRKIRKIRKTKLLKITKHMLDNLSPVKEEILPHKEKIQKDIDYNYKDLEIISGIRPHLAGEFRNLSDEELLISGIFIVAQKNNQ